jgi:hypothetical protein
VLVLFCLSSDVFCSFCTLSCLVNTFVFSPFFLCTPPRLSTYCLLYTSGLAWEKDKRNFKRRKKKMKTRRKREKTRKDWGKSRQTALYHHIHVGKQWLMRGQKRATNGTGGLLRWKRPCHLRHQLASLPLNDAWGQPHAVAGPIDGQRLGPRDNAEESKASSGTEERVNKDCMEKAFVEDLGSVVAPEMSEEEKGLHMYLVEESSGGRPFTFFCLSSSRELFSASPEYIFTLLASTYLAMAVKASLE